MLTVVEISQTKKDVTKASVMQPREVVVSTTAQLWAKVLTSAPVLGKSKKKYATDFY